jgi:hypothetical protein
MAQMLNSLRDERRFFRADILSRLGETICLADDLDFVTAVLIAGVARDAGVPAAMPTPGILPDHLKPRHAPRITVTPAVGRVDAPAGSDEDAERWDGLS